MLILQIILAVLAVLIIFVFLAIMFARLRILIIANNENSFAVKFYVFGIKVFSYAPRADEPHKKIKISKYSPKNIEKRRKKAMRTALKKKKRVHKEYSNGSAQKSTGKKNPFNIKNILKFILDVLRTFAEHYAKNFKIIIHSFNICIATDDPAKTALLYGTVAQSVSYLLEFLHNTTALKVLRSAPINVTSDFCGEDVRFDIKISMIVRLRRVLSLIFRSGIRSPADIEKFFNEI